MSDKTTQKIEVGPFDELFLRIRRETMKTAYIPREIREHHTVSYDYKNAKIIISNKGRPKKGLIPGPYHHTH